MIRKVFALIVLCIVSFASCSYASDAVPGDVLVVLRNTSGNRINSASFGGIKAMSAVKSFEQSAKVNVTRTYDALSDEGDYMFMLVHSDTKNENELLREIQKRPDVIAASLNHILYLNEDKRIPNDPDYFKLWGMEAINAPYAWNISTGSEDIYIAVIDTGVDANHPDLKDHVSLEYSRNFAGYGKVGYDETAFYDVQDHGSHCAGTIAAVGNNGTGVAGVNWKAKIIALRVFPDGNGARTSADDADIAQALNYIVSLLRNNPDIKIASVNLSLGGWDSGTPEQRMNDPFRLAFKTLSDMNRTVICVAAGNESHEDGIPSPDNDAKNGITRGYYCYPASFRGIDNMIVVAAAEPNLTRANYSNYGRNYVDVAAPGSNIFSTLRTSASEDLKFDVLNRRYPYDSKNGTSMATPHVTGVAGLLKAIFPDASASEIKAAILGGANGDYLRDDGTSRHGLIDITGAVEFMNLSRSQNTAPSISPVSIGECIVNQPRNIEFYAAGTPEITWSIEGDLPEGMNFDTSTAKITGTPAKEGTYSFIVTAENDYGYDSLVLDMNVSRGIAPVIVEEEVAEIKQSKKPMYYDVVTEGSQPVAYSLESTNMPESFNVKISADAGMISFIPAETGTYSFTVKASNYAGSDTKTIALRITEDSKNAPVIQTSELTTAVNRMPYGVQTLFDVLASLISTSPIGCRVSAESETISSWDVTGLPKGMTFEKVDDKTIIITGTPEEAGSFDVRIMAMNEYGIGSRDYVLSVENKAPEFLEKKPDVLPISMDRPIIERPTIIQRGLYMTKNFYPFGSRPLSFNISGDIPEGMYFRYGENTVNLEGVPSKTGMYEFDILVSNDFGRDSLNILLSVVEPVYITTNLLPDAIKGRSYDVKLDTFNNASLSWDISGDIPGLALSESGSLTGIPTEAGMFSISIKGYLPGNINVKNTRNYSLIVRSVPVIQTSGLPNGKVNVPYDNQTLRTDSSETVYWGVIEGDLPDGLMLSSNGVIYGTPVKAGVYTFNVMAMNAAGYDMKTFIIEIAETVTPGPEKSGDIDPSPTPTPTPTPSPAIEIGTERGIADITAGEMNVIASEKGMIAAILPEIIVDTSGMYSFISYDVFANINLSSDVPAGYSLVWHPFTRTGDAIEDEDSIAVFYDSDGEEIVSVNQNHIVNISAWLEAGKTYAPVISAVSSSESQKPGSSGGGGCNALSSGMALLIPLCMVIFRKR